MAPILEVSHLTKKFGKFTAVNDISFDIKEGEINLFVMSWWILPLSALPVPLQVVARAVPTSYVFEGMRQVLTTGNMDTKLLVISFLLNAGYLIGSAWFYNVTFRQARVRGWLIKLA